MKFKNTTKGFALLFSVLVSSLLLTIGLSIFSIALKELAISTASRQSIHAFFAADSGREYALYLDVKVGSLLPLDLNDPGSQADSTTIEKTFVISDINRTDDANFNVAITKTKAAGLSSPIITTVTAYGHNSDDDDRVERAIQQTY